MSLTSYIGTNVEIPVNEHNRVEQRQWGGADDGKLDDAVIVNMEPNTTVFWVSYDGDSIVTLSNKARFATYETIIQTFPPFTQPSLVEYD